MRKVTVIVARDQSGLYEYLKQGFEGVDGVQVILDRRVHVGDGRENARIDPERRQELGVYEELQLRGFIIHRGA